MSVKEEAVTYSNIAVPFLMVGNKRCLTDEQLASLPWLLDFFTLWKHRFERVEVLSLWVLIEDNL